TSQNKKKKKQKKREKKDRKSTYDHSEIISGIIKFIPESEMIRSMVKYSTGKTRHYLAISLVISLIIVMMFFGVLHAVVEKEIIESLDEFIRYSLTILGSLTSTAI
ncbi:MAG: hypothetical protein GTN82_23370, partial [Candidatus Aminicenantes bacterium]|nr:hypothetical protein [Candidatus Aminicenantes bacterium]